MNVSIEHCNKCAFSGYFVVDENKQVKQLAKQPSQGQLRRQQSFNRQVVLPSYIVVQIELV